MPIYEYECRKCKAHTEVFQKINDKPLTRCAKCKGRLDKLMSASAVHFKGTGWYVTDYAGKGKQSEAAEEKKSVSADAGKSGDKTEKTKTKDTPTSRQPASSESKTTSSKPSGGS
jgi:putative FmdB family regulatory protein